MSIGNESPNQRMEWQVWVGYLHRYTPFQNATPSYLHFNFLVPEISRRLRNQKGGNMKTAMRDAVASRRVATREAELRRLDNMFGRKGDGQENRRAARHFRPTLREMGNSRRRRTYAF